MFGWSSRPRLVGDDREDVLLADDEELVVLELELGPGVLAVEDLLPDLDVHRDALAVVVERARPDGEEFLIMREDEVLAVIDSGSGGSKKK